MQPNNFNKLFFIIFSIFSLHVLCMTNEKIKRIFGANFWIRFNVSNRIDAPSMENHFPAWRGRGNKLLQRRVYGIFSRLIFQKCVDLELKLNSVEKRQIILHCKIVGRPVQYWVNEAGFRCNLCDKMYSFVDYWLFVNNLNECVERNKVVF